MDDPVRIRGDWVQLQCEVEEDGTIAICFDGGKAYAVDPFVWDQLHAYVEHEQERLAPSPSLDPSAN